MQKIYHLKVHKNTFTVYPRSPYSSYHYDENVFVCPVLKQVERNRFLTGYIEPNINGDYHENTFFAAPFQINHIRIHEMQLDSIGVLISKNFRNKQKLHHIKYGSIKHISVALQLINFFLDQEDATIDIPIDNINKNLPYVAKIAGWFDYFDYLKDTINFEAKLYILYHIQ